VQKSFPLNRLIRKRTLNVPPAGTAVGIIAAHRTFLVGIMAQSNALLKQEDAGDAGKDADAGFGSILCKT